MLVLLSTLASAILDTLLPEFHSLSLHLPAIHPSIHLAPIHTPIHLPSIYLCIYLSIHPPFLPLLIHSSIQPSLYPLFIHLTTSIEGLLDAKPCTNAGLRSSPGLQGADRLLGKAVKKADNLLGNCDIIREGFLEVRSKGQLDEVFIFHLGSA